MVGMVPGRVALPVEITEAEPVSINAKQYHAIMRKEAATRQAWGSEQTNQIPEGIIRNQQSFSCRKLCSYQSFSCCNSRIFMNHDMSMLSKGQEDPVEDSSTPKNFFKNPSRLLPKNKNMTSRSNRQTCLDSKLMCCSTTKTVADQPLLALTLHVFPTVLISSDTLNSSFQVSQSQHRLTELYLFMVSPMTCMEVGTCTISLSISETLDHLVLFPCSHQTGEVILGYYY